MLELLQNQNMHRILIALIGFSMFFVSCGIQSSSELRGSTKPLTYVIKEELVDPVRKSSLKLTFGQKTNGSADCSAAIIGPNHIISAAHCFPDGKLVANVFAKPDPNETLRLPNAHMTRHQGFSYQTGANDLAVGILQGPLPFNLEEVRILESNHISLDRGLIYGAFGTLDNGPTNLDGDLKIFPNEIFSIAPDNLTFMDKGQGSTTCKGDSGGPVYAEDLQRPGEIGLVGIISKGTGTECRGQGININATEYKVWIACTFAQLGYPLLALNHYVENGACGNRYF
jgi:hypothetical protein